MTPADLIAARKALGLSQQGLADALGMSPTNGGRTIRRYETGEKPVPARTARMVRRLIVAKGEG